MHDSFHMPARISVFFGHIASNIGDLAINAGTIALLRSIRSDIQIEFVLLNAKRSNFLESGLESFAGAGVSIRHFTSHSGQGAGYLTDPAAFFAACGIAVPEHVLLASGEFLFDHGDTNRNDRNLFWRLLPAHAARQLGIPVTQLPATFGPLATTDSRDLIAGLLAGGVGAATRDARSQRFLTAEGLTAAPLPLLLDPAFFLPPAPRPTGSPGPIGLAFRSEGWGIRLPAAERRRLTDQFHSTGFADSRAFDIARRLIAEALAESDEPVHVFIQTFADLTLAEALKDAATDPDRVMLITPTSVADYVTRLAGLSRLYTSRFHGAIMALLSGTPAYTIYHDAHGHKMPGLYELLGWPQACHDAEARSTAKVVAAIAAARQDEAAAMARIANHLEQLRTATRDWLADELARPATPALAPGSLARPRLALRQMQRRLQNLPADPDLTPAEAAALHAAIAGARRILAVGPGDLGRLATTHRGRYVLNLCPDPAAVLAMQQDLIERAPPSLALARPDALDEALWAAPWFRAPDLALLSGPDWPAVVPALRRRAPDIPILALQPDDQLLPPIAGLVRLAGRVLAIPPAAMALQG